MGALNLRVTIDDKSGFCFGVRAAIEKAERTLLEAGTLYCLGEIVHNDEEVKRLERLGMKNISKDLLASARNASILFRAHGEPPESYEMLRKEGINLIDASCPVILKLQKRVKESYEAGENVFIYGKHNHPEVIALNGQTGYKAVVFEHFNELEETGLPERITLYSQTTMPVDGFYGIVRKLEQKGVEVKVKDTICRQVSHREPHLREFCRQFDKIVFVAGKHSSNGKVLFEVCKEENRFTHFVSHEDEVSPDWFDQNCSVGVCGSTSTPLWLMENIKTKLLAL